jgi:hypothetical protein
MNKRGQSEDLLPKETIQIIIAVICILALIAFVVYLYYNYTQNQQLTSAKSSLTYLITEINMGGSQATIYSPQGWFLASWPTTFYGPTGSITELPKLCSNNKWKKCICLCGIPQESAPASGDCDLNNMGYCLENDFSFNSINPSAGGNYIILGGDYVGAASIPLILSINQTNKLIQIQKNS